MNSGVRRLTVGSAHSQRSAPASAAHGRARGRPGAVRANVIWLAFLSVFAALAAVDIVVVYEISTAAGVLLPIAAVGALAVWRAPIMGVCAGILAVPLEGFGLRLGDFAGLSIAEACFIGTAAATALRWVVAGGLRPVHGAHAAFALLLLMMVGGYAVAQDPRIVTKILLMWSAFLVVSMLVARASSKELQRVLLSLGISAGVVGAVAILGAGEQELVSGGAIAIGRAQGTFDQPNLLGFFLALTIPVAVLMASRGPWVRRTAMLVAGGVAFAGLMLTLSRTSIVGTFVALLVLLAWRPLRRAAAVGLASLAVFALFNNGTLQQAEQVQVVGQRLGALASQGIGGDPGRYTLYTQTPEVIIDHPVLGVGQGNFSIAAAKYGIRDPDGLPFDHAHNLPLTVAAETGLLGLAALILFAAFVIRASSRALSRRTAVWPMALASTAALSAITVISLGDYPLRANVIMATILIHVGVIIGCERLARSDAPSDLRSLVS